MTSGTHIKLAVLSVLIASSTLLASSPKTLGFFPSSRESEARFEAIMSATPTPEQERKWLRWLTEEPHTAGTAQGKKTAEYVHDRLKEFGIKAELVPYEVFLNYPKQVSIRLLKPEPVELSLEERGDIRDKDSFSGDVFPGFHGYGASGRAAAQVIYVNYGTREDFEQLDGLGLSVFGKIALVRYGKVFRGLKVREAQERGAIGVIIFSDPADDGYMKGDVYPDGPMRPESALQRGSVQFLSEGPGDPTTPGWASVQGARRADATKLAGIPRIPSLPISYGEASKIMKALAGQRVPDGWQGGLPFSYHVGPGPAEVEMSVTMDYGYRTIWNVIGTIPGGVEKDRWVILGNHRDAWVYGAVDPNSGTASLLETARGLGEAVKAGWVPRRTLILASWDAEEYGLVGSTEWVEDHAAELSQKAVAYINLDSSVTGPALDAGGIPSLRDLFMGAAADVPDVRTGKTVFDLWMQSEQSEWAKSAPVDLEHPQMEFYPNLRLIGSGSDYTAFLDNLGIPALDFSFDGPYGVYHSVFDDITWMEKFGDPEYLYHVAASRLYGLLAMRLAGADLVPLRYGPYARRLQDDLDEIRRSAIIKRRTPRAAAAPSVKPPLDPDFTIVIESLRDFAAAAGELDAALDRVDSSGMTDIGRLPGLNDAVARIEREFLDPAGLPRRPWFKHTLVAPGYTVGYGAWTFPGIAHALLDRDQAMFDAEAKKVAARLRAATAAARAATALCEKP